LSTASSGALGIRLSLAVTPGVGDIG
jgi:hypothetical protein